MTQTGKLGVFVLAVAGAFTYLCNVIPQIQTGAAESRVEIGQTPEALVASGKQIFASDQAQCLTCHSLGEDPKARCPNQQGLGARARLRKPGMSGEEYLIESVYNPNAWVVPGYPKNQMKPVHKPPIALSHDEILAVTAYLSSLGSSTDAETVARLRKAQEPWRKGLLQPEAPVDTDRLPILAGDPGRGAGVFVEVGCNGCHRIGQLGRDIGPELSSVGASQSPDYILESILKPNAVIVKGYADSQVIFKNKKRINGRIGGWVPTQEQPRAMRIMAQLGGAYVERTIEMETVAMVGDTSVFYRIGREEKAAYGDYVRGDEKQGLVLRVWSDGRWREQRFEPAAIVFLAHAVSPMPDNFGTLLTPRQMYDLVAYLVAQKGTKP